MNTFWRMKLVLAVFPFFLAVLLVGCSGGGGGGAATTTTVSGVASKGPLNGSSVCAYAIAGGVMGAQIGSCSTTSATGNYSINLGTYTGPVLFQVTGGTYVNEATGTTVALASPMRSMLSNATGGSASVAVTALTELAYQNANILAGGLTSANIQSAITSVQNAFGVSDIVHIMPVDALNVPANATAAQKTYALALATVSQYLNGQPTGTSLTNALQTMQACLAAPATGCGTGATSVGTLLNTALSTFEAGHSAFSGMTLPVANFGSVITTVTSFTPATGAAGTTVTITGTGFDVLAQNNVVKFNGVAGTTVSATATKLTVTVPASATSGPITVTNSISGQTATATGSFTVTTQIAGTLAITGLNQTTAAPLALLTITGSGFDSSAMVNFSSTSSGFSVNLQPVVVSQTSLIVSVPILLSGANVVSGTVNVDVLQSSGQSNSKQLQITGLPSAPPLAAGTTTLGVLQGIVAIANQLISEGVASPLPADLAALTSALNAVIAQIQPVVNGTASTANLGTFNGQPLIVGATELAQMDQLYLALLQSIANSSGSGSSTATSLKLRSLSKLPRQYQSSSTGTGCLAAAAVAASNYDVIQSGGGTASFNASNLAYFNQTMEYGTSPAASTLIMDVLEQAPGAIVLISATATGSVVVPGVIVLSAEIIEALRDVVTISNGLSSEDNFMAALQAILNNLPGPTGNVRTLSQALPQVITDIKNIPQGTPPPKPQAALCVSQLYLNFGTVAINQSSSSQSVTLTNVGTAALTLNGADMAGVGATTAADFLPTSNPSASIPCGVTLAPAGTCTINVTFKPTISGDERAALNVLGPSNQILASIELLGTGQLSLSGGLSVAITSATCNILAPADSEITITGTVTGPVGTYLRGDFYESCASWQDFCTRDIADPPTSTWTGTGSVNNPLGGTYSFSAVATYPHFDGQQWIYDESSANGAYTCPRLPGL